MLNLSLSVGVSSFSPFRANDEEKVVSEELGSLNHGFLGSTGRDVEEGRRWSARGEVVREVVVEVANEERK